MNDIALQTKQIKTNINQINYLVLMGFTPSEVLFIIICLNLLDGANCLALTANTLSSFTGISERHIYRTLGKLKQLEVSKIRMRYDFTLLKQKLDSLQ